MYDVRVSAGRIDRSTRRGAPGASKAAPAIETWPLTRDRWRDLRALFSTSAVTRHCWCMWPRMASDYRARGDAANERAFRRVVETADAPPGVLAYVDGVPAGWCAVAPRADYPRLAGSPATRALDGADAWSIVCFYIRREARGRGVARHLLAAAVSLALEHGARIIEGYPIDGRGDPFHGTLAAFESAGFREVARRVANRPFMRYVARPRARRTARRTSGS